MRVCLMHRADDGMSGGNAGQRPTAPMGGGFTPTRGRALSLVQMVRAETQ